MRITESRLRQIIRDEVSRLVEMAPGVASPPITVQELHDHLDQAAGAFQEQLDAGEVDESYSQRFLDNHEDLEPVVGAPVSDLPGYTVVRFLSADAYTGQDFDVLLQHKDGSVANLSDLV